MKTTLKLIPFFLFTFIFIGCSENEMEENLEEETPTEDIVKGKNLESRDRITRGRIRRIRLKKMIIKQRLDMEFQITTTLTNNEATAEVASIDMKISTTDSKNQNSIFITQVQEKAINNAKRKKYTSKSFDLPYTFLGKTVTVTSIDRDIKGNQIGKPHVETIKVPERTITNPFAINEPSLTLNKDGETFTMQVSLKGDPKYPYLKLEMKEIMISSKIIPDDGGSESEEAEILLRYLGENKDGSFMYGNSTVKFIESDNVIDMEYMTTLSVIDAGGEELDYAEFRITGLE